MCVCFPVQLCRPMDLGGLQSRGVMKLVDRGVQRGQCADKRLGEG